MKIDELEEYGYKFEVRHNKHDVEVRITHPLTPHSPAVVWEACHLRGRFREQARDMALEQARVRATAHWVANKLGDDDGVQHRI